MMSGKVARHGLVLIIFMKEQEYQCMALFRGCKKKSMMTYGVMVEAKNRWVFECMIKSDYCPQGV
jgi:hypothetical protein